MSSSKKFFALVLSVSMLILLASESWAITGITSSLTPTSYSAEGTPILNINQGENFSVTLTAENPIGEIFWSLSCIVDSNVENINNDNVTLSSETGNTVTVSGTLSASSYSIGVTAADVSATDIERLAYTYNFWVMASSSPTPSPTPTPTPTPEPDPTPTPTPTPAPVSDDPSAYYNRNSGDSWADAYMINSVEDLKLMRSRADYYEIGKYYKLGADLDLSSETSWGDEDFYFFGHFDGQGHSITLNITRDTENDFQEAALFNTASGDILNLNVKGTIRSNWDSAGIVRVLYGGTIENCTFEGTLETETLTNTSSDLPYAAGIVNMMRDGTVRNCSFSGTMTTIAQGYENYIGSYAGGIVTFIFGGNIDNCNILSGSSISATSKNNNNNYNVAGGIAGDASYTYTYSGDERIIIREAESITNCTSNATITADKYSGGIVGLAYKSLTLSGNTWPPQYQEVGFFYEDIPFANSSDVTVAIIEPVTVEYDVLQNIAANLSIDASEIKLLTYENIDPSIPPDPTEEMKREAAMNHYEFAAKLNTITVSEDGWYVFQVTISDDLVGMRVNDLNLYIAGESDFVNGSSIRNFKKLKMSVAPSSLIDGLTGMFELTDLFGVELDTLPKKFLATMFLSASESLTVFILKTIFQLLLAACNLGVLSGGVVLVGGLILIKFYRRRR